MRFTNCKFRNEALGKNKYLKKKINETVLGFMPNVSLYIIENNQPVNVETLKELI